MIRFSVRSPPVLLLLVSLAGLSFWTYQHEGLQRQELTGNVSSIRNQGQHIVQQRLPPVQLPEPEVVHRLTPDEAFGHQDGLLYLRDVAKPGVVPRNTVEHPIAYLVREAERKWEFKLAKQSRTLGQAVATYRERYGRAPPAGFDKW